MQTENKKRRTEYEIKAHCFCYFGIFNDNGYDPAIGFGGE